MEERSAVLSAVTLHGGIAESGSDPRGAGGFTVVELLIAVLIVGILSAIAIPNYLRYLEKDKEATAISDINTIGRRLQEYRMEFPLPTDLSTINFGNALPLIDPWGNPYRYLPLYGLPGNLPQARRDHNLVPINSDFDLYSMGPDGLSAKPLTALRSRDDIIRANDGAFTGKASTYDP
jgi:general secretion pathway protein G